MSNLLLYILELRKCFQDAILTILQYVKLVTCNKPFGAEPHRIILNELPNQNWKLCFGKKKQKCTILNFETTLKSRLAQVPSTCNFYMNPTRSRGISRSSDPCFKKMLPEREKAVFLMKTQFKTETEQVKTNRR